MDGISHKAFGQENGEEVPHQTSGRLATEGGGVVSSVRTVDVEVKGFVDTQLQRRGGEGAARDQKSQETIQDRQKQEGTSDILPTI